jgi:hypothetical protein
MSRGPGFLEVERAGNEPLSNVPDLCSMPVGAKTIADIFLEDVELRLVIHLGYTAFGPWVHANVPLG